MTYILVENVKNWHVLCKLFLISKCSAWSANRALDQFSPLPFCGLGNLKISLADLDNHLIPGDDSSVVAGAERVTSSSSGNRIPQSWSDLGEIISSFSTEGPVKGPEMGRWTPPLVWIRLSSKSLSVIRSPFTKVYRKSNRGIWFSSSAISSFRGSTLGETEGRRQKITKEEKRVKSTHRSIQIFQSSEKGQSTREIASCKTKYNESRLVKRSSHPIQN